MADIRRIVELVVQVVDRATGPLRSVRSSTEAVDASLRKEAASAQAATKANEQLTKTLQREGQAAQSAAKGNEGLARSTSMLGAAMRALGGQAEATAKSLRSTGSAAAAAGTQAARLNQFVSQASASAFVLGTAFSILGTQLTGIFSGAVSSAAEFQDTLARVRAVSGATETDFARLTEVAARLGRETRFTAVEAAQGLEFLAKAGLDANEAIAALPTTLRLAQAGALGLGEASDIVTNILTASALEVEELDRVTDVLVKTFTSTNTSLTELGFAFRFIGTVASGVGNQFEDTAAALGLLADAGLKSTIGGTALRGALASLFAPTAEEARLLNELSERIGDVGLQITNTSGDFVGFRNLIEQLETAGITAGEAIELFGQRAGPAIQGLLIQGSDALNELFVELTLAGGTAEEIAAIMDDTLIGALRRVTSAIDGLAQAAAGPLLGPLQALLDGFASFVNVITSAIDSIAVLGPLFLTAVAVTGALATAVGILSIAYALLIRPLLDLLAPMRASIGAMIAQQRAALATAGAFSVLTTATLTLGRVLLRFLIIPGLILLAFEFLFRVVRALVNLFTGGLSPAVSEAAEELGRMADNFKQAQETFGTGSDELEAFIRKMEDAVPAIAEVADSTEDFNKVLEEFGEDLPEEVVERLRRRFAEAAVEASNLDDRTKQLLKTFDLLGDQATQSFGGLSRALQLADDLTQKLEREQTRLASGIQRAARASATAWRTYRDAVADEFDLASEAIENRIQRSVDIIRANASLAANEQIAQIAAVRQAGFQELERQQQASVARQLEILEEERRERIRIARDAGQDTLAVDADINARRQRLLRTRLSQAIANAEALFQEELNLQNRINDLEQQKEDSARTTEQRIIDIRRRFLSDEAAARDRFFETFKLQSQARRALAEGDAAAFDEALKALERADDLAEQNARDARSAADASRTLAANERLRQQILTRQQATLGDQVVTLQEQRAQLIGVITELRTQVENTGQVLQRNLVGQIVSARVEVRGLVEEFNAVAAEINQVEVARGLFEQAQIDLANFAQRVRSFSDEVSQEELLTARVQIQEAIQQLDDLQTLAGERDVEIPANLKIQDLLNTLGDTTATIQTALDQSEGVNLRVTFANIDREVDRFLVALREGRDVRIRVAVEPDTAGLDALIGAIPASTDLVVETEPDPIALQRTRQEIAQPVEVPVVPRLRRAIGGLIRSLRGPEELGPDVTVGIRGRSGGLIPSLAALGASVQKLSRGGRPRGKLPGFGGGDRVPALLEDGEFVMNKFRTRMFLPLLQAMNFAPLNQVQNALAGMSVGMAAGGPVGSLPSANDGISSRVALDLSFNGQSVGDGPLTGSSQTVNALVEALTDVARGRAGR